MRARTQVKWSSTPVGAARQPRSPSCDHPFLSTTTLNKGSQSSSKRDFGVGCSFLPPSPPSSLVSKDCHYFDFALVKAVKMGVPWYTYPLMAYSSRDPGECDQTPEQCAFKLKTWRNW